MLLHPLPGFAPTYEQPWHAQQIRVHREMSSSDRERLKAYLLSATLVVAWMEQTFDELGGAFTVPGGSALMTDGHYYWRVDAAWYVGHYGAILPDEVLEHFTTMSWKPKTLTLEEEREAERMLGDL